MDPGTAILQEILIPVQRPIQTRRGYLQGVWARGRVVDIEQISQLVADLCAIIYGDAPFAIHVDPHQPVRPHLQTLYQNQLHPFGCEKRFGQFPDLFRMSLHASIPSPGKKKWAEAHSSKPADDFRVS
jgi:hypothetical protein